MLALLLLAGVISTRPVPQAVPRLLSACNLVTRGDLQFAAGQRFGEPSRSESGAASVCDYQSGRGQIRVAIQRCEGKLDLCGEVSALQSEIEGSSARAAASFGPQAFFLEIAGAGTQLHIVRGNAYLMVSVLGVPGSEQVAERLARTALDRL